MATYSKKDFNGLESGAEFTVTAEINEGYGVEDVLKGVTEGSSPTVEPTGGESVAFTGTEVPGDLNRRGESNQRIMAGEIVFNGTEGQGDTNPNNYYIKARGIRFKVTADIADGKDTYGEVSVGGVDSDNGVPYNNDTAATVTATPKDPCTFAGWTKTGGGSTDKITPASPTAPTKSLKELKVDDVIMTADFNCAAAVADPYGNVLEGGNVSWVNVTGLHPLEDQMCVYSKHAPSNAEIETQKKACTKDYLRVYSGYYELVEDIQATIYTRKYVCRALYLRTQGGIANYHIPPAGSASTFNKNNALIYCYDRDHIPLKGYDTNSTISYTVANGYGYPQNINTQEIDTNGLLYGGRYDLLYQGPQTPPLWNGIAKSSWVCITVNAYQDNTVWDNAMVDISNTNTSHFDFSELVTAYPGAAAYASMATFSYNPANPLKGSYGWFELVYEAHNISSNIVGADDLLYYFNDEVVRQGNRVVQLRGQYVTPDSPEYITVYDADNNRRIYRKVANDTLYARSFTQGTPVGGVETITDFGTDGISFNYQSGECGTFNGWYSVGDNNGREYVTDAQGNNTTKLTVTSPDSCCTRYFPDVVSCGNDYVPYAYYNGVVCRRIAFVQTSPPSGGENVPNLTPSNADAEISMGYVNGQKYYHLPNGRTFDCVGCYLVMVQENGQVVGNYSLDGTNGKLTKIETSSAGGVSYKAVDSITANNNSFYFKTAYIEEIPDQFMDGSILVQIDNDNGNPEFSTYIVGDVNVKGFGGVLGVGYGFLYLTNSVKCSYGDKHYYGNVVYKNACGVSKSALILSCEDSQLSTALAEESKFVSYGFSVTNPGGSSVERYFKTYNPMDDDYYNNDQNNYNAIKICNSTGCGNFDGISAITQTYQSAPAKIIRNGSIDEVQRYVVNESVYMVRIDRVDSEYVFKYYSGGNYDDGWAEFDNIPWVINFKPGDDKKLLVFTQNGTKTPFDDGSGVSAAKYFVVSNDGENPGMKYVDATDVGYDEPTYTLTIFGTGVYQLGNSGTYSNTTADIMYRSAQLLDNRENGYLTYKPIWNVHDINEFVHAYENNIPYINIVGGVDARHVINKVGDSWYGVFGVGYYYLGFDSTTHNLGDSDDILSRFYQANEYDGTNDTRPSGVDFDNCLRNKDQVVAVSNINSDEVPVYGGGYWCDSEGYDSWGYYVGYQHDGNIYGLPYYNRNGMAVELMWNNNSGDGVIVASGELSNNNSVYVSWSGMAYGVTDVNGTVFRFVDYYDNPGIVFWYKNMSTGKSDAIYNDILDKITTEKINDNGVTYYKLTAPTSNNVNNPDGRDYIEISSLPAGEQYVLTTSAQTLGKYLNNSATTPPNYIKIGPTDLVLYSIRNASPNNVYEIRPNLGADGKVFAGIRFLANHYYKLVTNECYEISVNPPLTEPYILQFLGWLVEGGVRFTFYCDRFGNSNGPKRYFPFINGYELITTDELQSRPYLKYLHTQNLFSSIEWGSYISEGDVQLAYMDIKPEAMTNQLLMQSCITVRDVMQLEYATTWGKSFYTDSYDPDVSYIDPDETFANKKYYIANTSTANVAIAYNNQVPLFYVNGGSRTYRNKTYVSDKYYINNVVQHTIYNQEDAEYVLKHNTNSDFYLIADYEKIGSSPSGVTVKIIKSIEELKSAVETNVEYIKMVFDPIGGNVVNNVFYRYNVYENGAYYKRTKIQINNNTYHGGDVVKRVAEKYFYPKDKELKALPCQTCTALYTYNFYIQFCQGSGSSCLSEEWLHGMTGYLYDGVPMDTCSPRLDHRHFINEHKIGLLSKNAVDNADFRQWRSRTCDTFGGYQVGCSKYAYDYVYAIDRGDENDISTYIDGLLPICTTGINSLNPVNSCESKIITNSPETILQTSTAEQYAFDKLVYRQYTNDGSVDVNGSAIYTWDGTKYVEGGYNENEAQGAFGIYKKWSVNSITLSNRVKAGCYRARITNTRSYESDNASLLASTYIIDNSNLVGYPYALTNALQSFAKYIYIPSVAAANRLNNQLKEHGYDFKFDGPNYYYVNYERVYNISDITNYQYNETDFCDFFVFVFNPNETTLSINQGYMGWEEMLGSTVTNPENITTEEELRLATESHFNNLTNPVNYIVINPTSSGNMNFQGMEFARGAVYKWVDQSGCPMHGFVYGGCKYPFSVFAGVLPTLAAPSISRNGFGKVTITHSNTTATGVQIRYTDNGSTPTETSTLYAGPIQLVEGSETTIKAICVASGYTKSTVTEKTYGWLESPSVTEIIN